jgi:hypothetical protein
MYVGNFLFLLGFKRICLSVFRRPTRMRRHPKNGGPVFRKLFSSMMTPHCMKARIEKDENGRHKSKTTIEKARCNE